ncbi:MAG: iron-sulfur cluster assembly accessory protein [Leptolyngbyaceae cyanobacterium RU_5_1]|nr:iron-sulfur cluster assembly accessory protein [Leptolyngbyaceae cyanobacterium RU_5_1]
MIQLSHSAINEVLRLKARTQNPGLKLRIAVLLNGCLDRSYAMTLDNILQPGDQVYDCDSLQVVVSPDTLPYIDGLVVDYSEDLMGGSFRFHNPNAVQSCSCGNSFSISS